MNKKYFFFDIDGTLIAGGYGRGIILDSTLQALDMLRANGHFVAIATGRGYVMAKDQMKELGILNMVSDGGNGITLNGELQGIEPLNKDNVCRLLHECEEKGYPWALQREIDIPCVSADKAFDSATNNEYVSSVLVPGLRPEDCEHIYKAYIACRYPAENSLEALKELPFCRFDEKFFFVEPCDKSVGIKKIVKHFGGREEDVVVFGDALNDMSMFLPQWTCIAMGNAVDELKARADYITDSCYEDGIFNACKKFGWI